MRWDSLFADLEAEYDALQARELAAELPDRVRGELASVTLADRLRAAIGREVSVTVAGGGALAGRLLDVGSDWLLVQENPGRQGLVPLASVSSFACLARGARVAEPGSVAARLPLTAALRAVARDRGTVAVMLTDGATLHGVIARVGADFVDVAVVAPGEPPRRPGAAGARTLRVAAIAAVRTGGE